MVVSVVVAVVVCDNLANDLAAVAVIVGGDAGVTKGLEPGGYMSAIISSLTSNTDTRVLC